jgi:hypothetical protein
MTNTLFDLKGGLRNRGGGNDGQQIEFSFEGKLAWGCVGEVHPSLYRSVGGVGFELEIKSEFN